MDTARIRARIERQYVLLHVRDDLDAAGNGPLRHQLDAIDECTDVVVDMSAVAQGTDEGWSMLVDATRRLRDADGSLTLSRLRPEVRTQLRTSGYADQLKVRRRDR